MLPSPTVKGIPGHRDLWPAGPRGAARSGYGDPVGTAIFRGMVINDRHRFVFIHVPKSAGRSMKQALEALPGNNSRWPAASNHEPLSVFRARWRQRRSLADRILRRSPDGYTTFGFVRNPWDRIASLYRYLTEKSSRKPGVHTLKSFEDFLLQADDGVAWINELHSFRRQTDFFTDEHGRTRIEFVGHFEHLEEDVARVGDLLGIGFRMPHINRSSNSDRDYRQDYRSDRLVAIIRNRFGRDIEQFGYEFDQRFPRRRCSGRLLVSPE